MASTVEEKKICCNESCGRVFDQSEMFRVSHPRSTRKMYHEYVLKFLCKQCFSHHHDDLVCCDTCATWTKKKKCIRRMEMYVCDHCIYNSFSYYETGCMNNLFYRYDNQEASFDEIQKISSLFVRIAAFYKNRKIVWDDPQKKDLFMKLHYLMHHPGEEVVCKFIVDLEQHQIDFLMQGGKNEKPIDLFQRLVVFIPELKLYPECEDDQDA